jgi:alpha-galactosidase
LSAGIGLAAPPPGQAPHRGADFVVVNISTGGFVDAPRSEIPERFGVRQSVGDTVGPGGSDALRNIPCSSTSPPT